MEKDVDITKRWVRMGWTPPSRDPHYLQKWRDFKRFSSTEKNIYLTNLKEANETNKSPQPTADLR